jgi:hypothetical protein
MVKATALTIAFAMVSGHTAAAVYCLLDILCR